ncbi:transglutaminase domain-containing protein [Glaciecola sp. SC05]|uniref:transglutaminase domain-containing protein n=1 Tax=Glaciecola sp. SC05 TaxID=1987355 RepID=UPI0035298595
MIILKRFLLLTLLLAPSFTYAAPVDPELVSLAKQYQANTQSASKVRITRLLMDVNINVSATKATKTLTSIWYYPNQSSVQDAGYDSIYFNGHSERVSKLQALSLAADGSIDWFDPEDARVLESDSYNVFSEGKEKVVNYVGLQQGSISVLRYTIETDLTKNEVPWSDLIYVQSYSAFQKVNITVTGTADSLIFANTSSDLIQCQQSDFTITCEGQNIPRLESRDTFYFSDVASHVAFSTERDWEGIIDTMLNGYSVARSDNSSVLRQLSSMISPEMNIEDKITAIHQYVARDIRYLSESEAGNAYTPHSVSRTVDKKYGDCKDKTVLLLEMFEQIGVDAHPVLVSTRRQSSQNVLVPSAAYFNHVIMCFTLTGTDYCIDATDSTSDWRYMSEWVQGHVALPLKNGAVVTRTLLEPYAFAIQNHITIDILENGGQLETQRIEFQGAYASEYRGTLETKEPEEQHDYLVEVYQDYVSEDAEPTVSVTGVSNLEQAIVMVSENEFEPYLDMTEDISVIDYEPWIRGELNSYSPDNRRYAIEYAGSKVLSTVVVTLPAGWEVKSHPASLRLDGAFGSLSRTVTQNKDGSFNLTTEFLLPAFILQVADTEAFKNMIEVFKEQAIIRFTATNSNA